MLSLTDQGFRVILLLGSKLNGFKPVKIITCIFILMNKIIKGFIIIFIP